MTENYTKTIELLDGITTVDKETKEEIRHTKVTFGNRLTGADYFNLDNDPQAKNPTQYEMLIRRKMITSFGTLRMPVALNLMLGMDSIDLDDLGRAADEFVVESRGERISQFRPDNEVKLRFGFEIDGTCYDIVKFGNRLTGRDEVEADNFGNGVMRLCYQIGRQICRISTDDGSAAIDGSVDISRFEKLDGEDINALRTGAELWRQSFRFKRKNISSERSGKDDIYNDA